MSTKSLPVNEHRIVCRAVVDKEYRPLLDRRVTVDWFHNDRHRKAIGLVLHHLEKYGKPPSRVTLIGHMGSDYDTFKVREPLEYLLDEQAKANRYMAMRKSLPAIEDLLDDYDIDSAIAAASRFLAEAESFNPVPVSLSDSMANDRVDERWDDYLRRESGKVLLGLSTGFPTIDAATLGLQPGQLITLLAQPKVGKTSVSMAIANHVYLKHTVSPLFVSFEMSVRELEMRQESMMAKVNFKDLQTGKLSKRERKQYREYLDHVKAKWTHSFHFMDSASGSTVGSIRSFLDRYSPALCIVDGAYMLLDEITGESNTPQALTNITRSLKQLAIQFDIPILINTQALGWKSKGHRLTMDSAGYSSSFAQDSDVVLGVERVTPPKGEDESLYANQRVLKILASRNTGLASTDLVFDYNSGEIEELAV